MSSPGFRNNVYLSTKTVEISLDYEGTDVVELTWQWLGTIKLS